MDNNNTVTSFEHLFTDKLKKELQNKEVKRVYAVMQFNTEMELGISNAPYKWINTYNKVTTNGMEALHTFITCHNPTAQILDAESFEDLNKQMIQMLDNYTKEEYVNSLFEDTYY